MSRRVSPTEAIRAEIDALFTGDRDLVEMLEDVARSGARLIIQTAIEAEVDAFLGRARYERAAHARTVAAKTGRLPGRPRKMTDDQIRRAIAALNTGESLAQVAADYDVDRSTLYQRVQHLRQPKQTPRCRTCETALLAPEAACTNCDQDNPAPPAHARYNEVCTDNLPEPNDHGGLTPAGRPTIAPGSLADQRN